jgi:putative hemolysin
LFYQDGTAIADAATMLARRDKDAFDKICDHLLVIDHAAKPSMSGKQPVVGTYRLLRQDVAENHGGFYTEDEFDISGLVDRHAGMRFLDRTILRAAALPQQTHRRIALARDLELCPPASARRDDRLRQLRGH